MSVTYSVVIPLKDEEENVSDLLREIEPIMDSLQAPWELICIDDGSQDRTREILIEETKTRPYLRALFFNRNYGQSSAFDAGFRAARGDIVISLDGDRQNDPADIPLLLSSLEESDLVCGKRMHRQDPWAKKIISFWANAIRKRLCEDGVSDTGCSLKAYRKICLEKIKLYQGMHRFLPALFKIEGFRVKEVPVRHRKRMKGQTKYNFFNRSFNTIADLLAVRWMKKRHLRYRIEKELFYER